MKTKLDVIVSWMETSAAYYCYISVATQTQLILFVTLLELSALADLMGPYGIRHLGAQLTDLVSTHVKEIKVSSFVLGTMLTIVNIVWYCVFYVTH